MSAANHCPIPDLSGVPMAQSLPSPGIMTSPRLWNLIAEEKNKAGVIKAMREYISSQGGFAGCPQEVREKLERMGG